MTTLTIFANFYINDEERFLRMQDSFSSISEIDAKKWVVNVRGKYKLDTLHFLKSNLGERLVPYMLDSNSGWFHDTRCMLDAIDTDYVLFWVEDHVNIADSEVYTEVLHEMKESRTEYLCYSWWHFGKLREPYREIKKTEHDYISTFLFDKNARRKMNPRKIYIVSLQGIFSTSLFKKIVNTNVYFSPFPKVTPFDFEKSQRETKWLPIRYSIPKCELFASIDDNHGEDGYSLQDRGLYPRRVTREVQKPVTKNTAFQKVYRSHIKSWLPKSLFNTLLESGKILRRLKKWAYFKFRSN